MTCRRISILILMMGFLTLRHAAAQLPANPWATVPEGAVVSEKSASIKQSENMADAAVGHITAPGEVNPYYIPSPKYAPLNADATAPVYRPAIDSQGNSSWRSSQGARALGNQSGGYALPRSNYNLNSADGWRGSGKYGNQAYTGAVTTYGRAYGQEMLAPEVNNNNMNVMIQRLRDLGYNIPASYDNKFNNFLSDYTNDLQRAYSGLGRQNNPVDTVFNGILDGFEHFTGLDVGNLMFNSINLIQRD